MKRPAHQYAFGGEVNKLRSECTTSEQAMASVAWLADNFHYSSYEQAQRIAREVIDAIRALDGTKA